MEKLNISKEEMDMKVAAAYPYLYTFSSMDKERFKEYFTDTILNGHNQWYEDNYKDIVNYVNTAIEILKGAKIVLKRVNDINNMTPKQRERVLLKYKNYDKVVESTHNLFITFKEAITNYMFDIVDVNNASVDNIKYNIEWLKSALTNKDKIKLFALWAKVKVLFSK